MTEWEGLLRIALAAVLGGAVGLEREFRGKSAGIRTLALVAIGAATFVVVALLLAGEPSYNSFANVRLDPMKVIGETIGGIGFLGGAIVFRREDRAEGVTTAAAIWVATGIGLSSGAGYFIVAVGGTVLLLGVLYLLGVVEAKAGFSAKDEYSSTLDPTDNDRDDRD